MFFWGGGVWLHPTHSVKVWWLRVFLLCRTPPSCHSLYTDTKHTPIMHCVSACSASAPCPSQCSLSPSVIITKRLPAHHAGSSWTWGPRARRLFEAIKGVFVYVLRKVHTWVLQVAFSHQKNKTERITWTQRARTWLRARIGSTCWSVSPWK